MKKILVLLFFISTVSIFAASAKTDLWKYLSQLKTYSANFQQITYDTKGNVQQTSVGKMALMRPGYFRWETLKPVHQTLIANQNTLWVYDIDLQQATKQPLKQQSENNPAALLSGSVSDAQKQFVIQKLQVQTGYACFTLKPKVKQAILQTVGLCFKKNILQSMAMVNHFGDKTIFKFSSVQFNQPLSAKQFQFKPPRGVDILNNN